MRDNFTSEIVVAQEALELAKQKVNIARNQKIKETIKVALDEDEDLTKLFDESLNDDNIRHVLAIAIDLNCVEILLNRQNINSNVNLARIKHVFWTSKHVTPSMYKSESFD